MITSRILWSAVGAMGAVALGTAAVHAAAPTAEQTPTSVQAHAKPAHVLRFVNTMDSFRPDDVAPKGPSAGDVYLIGSHVSSGDVRGRTVASCVITTGLHGGVRQCEIDFLLSHGTVATRGITDLASTKVTLVVTGGTDAYRGANGTGTLTPTKTGSRVVLRLR